MMGQASEWQRGGRGEALAAAHAGGRQMGEEGPSEHHLCRLTWGTVGAWKFKPFPAQGSWGSTLTPCQRHIHI